MKKESEHQECCLKVQRLCAQLEKAQGSLHSQELELGHLRPLEMWLGQYQREKQVSGMEIRICLKQTNQENNTKTSEKACVVLEKNCLD